MLTPAKWDEEYLESLIQDQVEEGQELDYKASDSLPGPGAPDKKKVEFCKDVSAFANASGGILIYGITEEELNDNGKKVRYRPVAIDDGVDISIITKEHLSRILNDGIQRRVEYSIYLVTLSQKPGRHAIVIQIPQSTTAHQVTASKDYRYYRRYEAEILGMQDYEIRDVMNRGKSPDLWVDIKPIEDQEYVYITSSQWHFNIACSMYNYSSQPANSYILRVWFDKKIRVYNYFPKKLEGSITLPDGNSVEASYQIGAVTTINPIFGTQPFDIFHGEIQTSPSFGLEFEKSACTKVKNIEAYLKWELESPNMLPRYTIYKIKTGSELKDFNRKVSLDIEIVAQGLSDNKNGWA